MDVPSNWTCPVCGQGREDVTYVTPCQHRLCYGCAIWWAKKQPSCAVCGHKIFSIRYSMRADDDYLECSIPQPTGHSDDGLQDEQGPAETVLVPPEHSFPAEVWAAFFKQHPEDLAPLLLCLQEEFRAMSGDNWWEVQLGLWATVNLICEHGLDQAALVQELEAMTNSNMVPLVQRLISIAAALYGPLIQRQLDQRDGHAAGGREDGPAASPSISTSHLDPPASGTEELLGSSTGGSGHPSTATATAAEEPQEEPGQAAAAGPSIQSRDRSCGRPRRAPKRKTCSSPQDSPPPRKRRPRRRR